MNSTVGTASTVNRVSKWSDIGIRRSEQVAIERAHTAHLAHQLSSVALEQWEKALTGIVALPAAAALGVAATATYGIALIERTFEVFESAVGSVGQSFSHDRSHAVTAEPDATRNESRS